MIFQFWNIRDAACRKMGRFKRIPRPWFKTFSQHFLTPIPNKFLPSEIQESGHLIYSRCIRWSKEFFNPLPPLKVKFFPILASRASYAAQQSDISIGDRPGPYAGQSGTPFAVLQSCAVVTCAECLHCLIEPSRDIHEADSVRVEAYVICI